MKRKMLMLAAVLAAMIMTLTLPGTVEKANAEETAGWPVLREDCFSEDQYEYALQIDWGNITVLGGTVLRHEVTSIEFEGTLDNAPRNARDVSQAGDGRVLSWVTDLRNGRYILHIAGDGGIRLPENCTMLFGGYKNVTEIRFNSCVSASLVKNMEVMFGYCSNLTEVDLSYLDMSNVTDMGGMFFNCRCLEKVFVSPGFVASDSMADIFRNCPGTFIYTVDALGANWPVMRADAAADGSALPFVLGSEIPRTDIGSIRFQGNFDNASENAWDVSQAQDGTVLAWVKEGEDGLYDLCIAGNGGVNLPENCASLFAEYDHAKVISFNDCVCTTKATNMYGMFQNCWELARIGAGLINTASVTDMSDMFSSCLSLGWLDMTMSDTGNVTDMSGMFSNCCALETLNLSYFNTGNVTDMSRMFSNCCALEKLNVSSFDTRNVTDMSGMFNFCWTLKEVGVSGFDTGSVIDMSQMFSGCESLESLNVYSFDTANVTDMSQMFSGCSGLDSLNLSRFNTKNVTNIRDMFSDCISLKTLDVTGFDTSNVLNMRSMFAYCYSLEQIRASRSFVIPKISEDMFDRCPANGLTYNK